MVGRLRPGPGSRTPPSRERSRRNSPQARRPGPHRIRSPSRSPGSRHPHRNRIRPPTSDARARPLRARRDSALLGRCRGAGSRAERRMPAARAPRRARAGVPDACRPLPRPRGSRHPILGRKRSPSGPRRRNRSPSRAPGSRHPHPGRIHPPRPGARARPIRSRGGSPVLLRHQDVQWRTERRMPTATAPRRARAAVRDAHRPPRPARERSVPRPQATRKRATSRPRARQEGSARTRAPQSRTGAPDADPRASRIRIRRAGPNPLRPEQRPRRRRHPLRARSRPRAARAPRRGCAAARVAGCGVWTPSTLGITSCGRSAR